MVEKNYLHLVNGDDLTFLVQQLGLEGEIITWREMLCEGPCTFDVGDEQFIRLRQNFLREAYGVTQEEYRSNFLLELEKLGSIAAYDEIVLWFEFDLFSHMNMLAAISFLQQQNKKFPLYLLCNKKLKGEKEMAPLSELSPKSLIRHYKNRIPLTLDDIATAELIYELYCGNKPKRLISEISKSTNFAYLSSCIRAHIERFPSTQNGLNSLENNVLRLISEHRIKSLNHLLGYALKYQGYYGYVDAQMQRVIDRLSVFYTVSEEEVKLNENGMKALEGKKNFYQLLKDEEYYGGARKYDFLYNPQDHDILKL